MFTGIVQSLGRVVSLEKHDVGHRLTIDPGGWVPPGLPVRHGDSICVSGVCLTVVDLADSAFGFDVVPETLSRTTLGSAEPGTRVNLEGSLTAQQPLGGHFVQGHVEGVGVVRSVQQGEDWRITLEAPAELRPCIIPKGSITVDGVSMTVAAVTAETFDLAVIPATRALTTLGSAREGTRINIETDILTRTVVRTLEHLLPQASRINDRT